MPAKIARNIIRSVERELWARASGRCQFNGCNKLLYKSPITHEKLHIAEKAHIYSFSKDGPRGQGPMKTENQKLNEIENLILVCHDCHLAIDQDKKGSKYSPSLLKKWKSEQEDRNYIATSILPENKSHVVIYESNIGEQKSSIQKMEAIEVMFPKRYPVDGKPIILSMSCAHEDVSTDFWKTESNHLRRNFEKQIEPRIDENNPTHFSIFALAPIPLLIFMGTLFTDKIDVDVYQPIREPKTWKWQEHPEDFEFIVRQPESFEDPPVLILSLSDKVDLKRITSVVKKRISIWEITVEDKYRHNDFIKSQQQLFLFRRCMRKLLGTINNKHGLNEPLMIFPAMPASCSIEMGRVRMPKASMPWIIFDQNNKKRKFIKTLNIGGAL